MIIKMKSKAWTNGVVESRNAITLNDDVDLAGGSGTARGGG
jgi:hypothetical protein